MDWFTFFVVMAFLAAIAKPIGKAMKRQRRIERRKKEIQEIEEFRFQARQEAKRKYYNSKRIEVFESQAENNFPYKKADLLTSREKEFYLRLKEIADKYNLHINSKTRLADIVNVNGFVGTQQYFNKIKAKHIDFVLADKTNMNTLLAIELDDNSHLKASRIERDCFVDNVLTGAGIPIIHTYSTNGLEETICEVLGLAETTQTESFFDKAKRLLLNTTQKDEH